MAKKILRDKQEWMLLSGDEFIEAMKGQSVIIENEGKHCFLEKNGLSQDTVVLKKIMIEDSMIIGQEDSKEEVFEFPVIIEEGDFQGKFEISNSVFKKHFSINGTFQSYFTISGGVFNGKVWISGGEFNSSFRIDGGNFQIGLWVDDGIFKGYFSIDGGNFYNEFRINGGNFHDSFSIGGGIFHEYVSIHNGSFQGFSTIDGGDFEKGFWINGGEFKNSFLIKGAIFHGRFHISGGNFYSTFWIKGGVFNSNFWINAGTFQKKLLIDAGIFQKEFMISGGQFNRFSLAKNSEFHDDIRIVGGKIDNIKLSITNGFINRLFYQLEEVPKFEVNACNINTIVFDSIIKNTGSIYLQNFELNRLEFTENFKNESTFFVAQVKATNVIYHHEKGEKHSSANKPSLLLLHKCDMGSIVFIDALFTSFDKIILHRSKLNNISTSHGHFPLKTKHSGKVYTNSRKEEYGFMKYDENYSELAETYNHLQLAMQQQGNRTWAFKYYAEYMEWYRLEQKEKKNWAQYITLSLNKLSTNYGASWIRSFLMILGVALIFFFAYILFLPDVKVGFEFLTWTNIKENVTYFSRYYFDFIIPTHKIDFIGEYKAGFWSALIDIIGRILIGYLIYQTIAAFRQFGKR